METAGQDPSHDRFAHPQTLLRLRDVAARLDLSVSSVRRLIRDRKLPVVKLNTAVRVREHDLEALLEHGLK
jgi:excisionase family DNA binding protein